MLRAIPPPYNMDCCSMLRRAVPRRGGELEAFSTCLGSFTRPGLFLPERFAIICTPRRHFASGAFFAPGSIRLDAQNPLPALAEGLSWACLTMTRSFPKHRGLRPMRMQAGAPDILHYTGWQVLPPEFEEPGSRFNHAPTQKGVNHIPRHGVFTSTRSTGPSPTE